MLLATPFFCFSILSIANEAENFYQKSFKLSQQGLYQQAIIWTQKSAQLGFAPAQHNLGLSYLHGLGIKTDEKEANHWFLKSAEQGLPDAQSELAMSYYLARGVAKDLKKAEQYWQSAAKQNDEYAQFNLATLYLEIYQPQKAIKWFEKALINGHPNAKTALVQLEKINKKK